jgi:hypothetical protein
MIQEPLLSLARQAVRDWLFDISQDDDELLCADGFEEAFIGVGRRCSRPDVAVYDVSAMIQVLIDRDGMSHLQAVEYLEFNVVGAWVGEQTPIYVYPETWAEHTE